MIALLLPFAKTAQSTVGQKTQFAGDSFGQLRTCAWACWSHYAGERKSLFGSNLAEGAFVSHYDSGLFFVVLAKLPW
jgi:hypothetical protein